MLIQLISPNGYNNDSVLFLKAFLQWLFPSKIAHFIIIAGFRLNLKHTISIHASGSK